MRQDTEHVALEEGGPEEIEQRIKGRCGRQDFGSKGEEAHHIFFGSSLDNEGNVSPARVGTTERFSTLGCSLSDHFFIEATLSCSAALAQEPEVLLLPPQVLFCHP